MTALLYFFEQKMCGMIKGRGVADGSTQLGHSAKAFAHCLQRLSFLLVRSMRLKGDVAKVDLSGCLQVNMDKLVPMKAKANLPSLS